jgi:hypothetical protein
MDYVEINQPNALKLYISLFGAIVRNNKEIYSLSAFSWLSSTWWKNINRKMLQYLRHIWDTHYNPNAYSLLNTTVKDQIN